MKNLLLSAMFVCFFSAANAQKYVCYQDSKNKKLQITVYFNDQNKAEWVKYKGQKDSTLLTFENASVFETDSASTYTEKVKGKTTGTYIFDFSPKSYFVQFTREKDDKMFMFNPLVAEKRFYDKPCF